MVAFGVLVSWATVDNWATMAVERRAEVTVDEATLAGRHFAQLAIGVAGVIAISGEYATGMIRATLAAVPRRLPVLWAKLSVFATVTLVLMTLGAFAGFFAGNAILAQHWEFALSDPGVLRAVFGTAAATDRRLPARHRAGLHPAQHGRRDLDAVLHPDGACRCSASSCRTWRRTCRRAS